MSSVPRKQLSSSGYSGNLNRSYRANGHGSNQSRYNNSSGGNTSNLNISHSSSRSFGDNNRTKHRTVRKGLMVVCYQNIYI